jgi:hypothetical protein
MKMAESFSQFEQMFSHNSQHQIEFPALLTPLETLQTLRDFNPSQRVGSKMGALQLFFHEYRGSISFGMPRGILD